MAISNTFRESALNLVEFNFPTFDIDAPVPLVIANKEIV